MSDEVEIIFPPAGSFGGNNIAELEKRIASSLKGRVEKAFAFGSFARKRGEYDSDIDLILVQQTSQRFPRRALEFSDLLDIYPAMDILVYTPEEFKTLTNNPAPGFWHEVTKEMRRIL